MIIKEIVAHKKSFAKTALLYASFMGLGLHMGMPGPAMLDLRQAAQATAQEITWIFPIGSAGYLTGSVITGLLFDRFNPQIFMATFSLLLAVAAVIFPWNRQLWSLSLTNFLAQTGGGAMDSGGNAWLLHLWGASAAPFMQASLFSLFKITIFNFQNYYFKITNILKTFFKKFLKLNLFKTKWISNFQRYRYICKN